jgi:hypothetical protein
LWTKKEGLAGKKNSQNVGRLEVWLIHPQEEVHGGGGEGVR